MSVLWIALIAASIGSWLLKLAGLSLPASLIARPRVQHVAGFLPVALLSALVVTEMFDGGGQWTLDWRVAAGLAAAIILLLLRRGFLIVFFGAIIVTALLRLIPM